MKKYFRYVLILFAFIILFAITSSSQIIEGVKTTKLDNGLTVITLGNKTTPLVGVQIFYHAGLRSEPRGLTGINQICAHIISQGTEHCRKEDFARLINSAGGIYSYNVMEDFVNFAIRVPSGSLDTILTLEADRMQNLQISYENLTLAKDDIREMRARWLRQDMYALVNEEIVGLSYRVHPYKNPPYGLGSDIDELNMKDVKKYLSFFFQPSNAVIVIVGDFNEGKTIERIEELFGSIFSQPVPALKYSRESEQIGERLSFIESDVGVPAIITAFHIPSFVHEDYLPLAMAANILTVGESSRLYKRLVIEDNRAMAVGGGLMQSEDPGLFFVWSVLNYESDISEAMAIFDEEIRDLCLNGITEQELERAKNRVEFDYYRELGTFLNKSFMIGYYYLTAGDWNYINSFVKKARSVTADDIQKAASNYLIKRNRSTVVLQPHDDTDDLFDIE
ncbi:MAG: pitrilysin family protein [Candidatus Zixiibacteriota bacterium]